MSRTRTLSLVAVLATATTFSVAAFAKMSKVGAAAATFRAAGPAGLNIDGKTSDLTVADDGSNIAVTVPLSGLTTGIELRDKHMKEALETQKHPSAELVVGRNAIKIPQGGEVSADAKGTLKLHGQSKPITFHYTAKPDGSGFDVTGTARIDMTEFGIKPPSYLGVAVKPNVDVRVTFKVSGS